MADSASSIAFLTHPELVLDTPSGSLYYANYQSLVKGEGMTDERNSEARERVLVVAERLFMERGYLGVSLRDVAQALGMQKASLYNHAPQGKESLFLTVMERSLKCHGQGIAAALAAAPPDLTAQLRAVAAWLFSQPPLHLQRIQVSDLSAVAPAHAEQMLQLILHHLLLPIDQVVRAAAARGEVGGEHVELLGGTFLAALEPLRDLAERYPTASISRVEHLITLLLDGARPR